MRFGLVLVLLVACAEVPAVVVPRVDAAAASGSGCLVGERRACVCSGGVRGAQVCGADAGLGEIWGPCVCA